MQEKLFVTQFYFSVLYKIFTKQRFLNQFKFLHFSVGVLRPVTPWRPCSPPRPPSPCSRSMRCGRGWDPGRAPPAPPSPPSRPPPRCPARRVHRPRLPWRPLCITRQDSLFPTPPTMQTIKIK